MKQYVFDIEVLPNYILIAFRDQYGNLEMFDTKASFTSRQRRKMLNILENHEIVGFNSRKYDVPIITHVLTKPNHNTRHYHATSKKIINDRMSYWNVYKTLGVKEPKWNHIDVIEPAPSVACSLKLYGTRLGCKRLQEFPVDFEQPVTDDEILGLREYCENDLIITQELYKALRGDIDLRIKMSNQYKMDLRSLSGAQIAQKILVQECDYQGKAPPIPDFVRYTPPEYLQFKSKRLNEVFKYVSTHKFLVGDSGNVKLPALLTNSPIVIDDITHKMGIGGLHGSVSNETITSDATGVIVDADVTSYYPSMMIENNYTPRHFGGNFLNVYKGFYDKRIAIKRRLKELRASGTSDGEIEKDLNLTQESYKLMLNSTFGVLGSRYSKLYAPDMLLQITLTGQLTLLMVIEALSDAGVKVFYSNTDGITYKTKRPTKAKKIINNIAKKARINFEYATFKKCHIRDVNNFINITMEDKVKSKGSYSESNLNKNIEFPIVYEAIREYLSKGTRIKDTIDGCKDILQFTSARTVKGGAIGVSHMPEFVPDGWDESLARYGRVTQAIIKKRTKLEKEYAIEHGIFLGKVVRWYYSTDGSTIYYKSNGNKVPKSDGSKYLMNLTDDLPEDLDYKKYYEYANEYLNDLGVSQ